MNFNLRRAVCVAKKEVKHVSRDPFTLVFALGLPVLLVVFFGFIIDFNYRDVRLMVEDRDHTRYSRQFAEIFSASGYFRLAPLSGSPVSALDAGKAAGVLLIEPEFGRDAASGKGAKAQLILDGSDNSKTAVVLGYLNGISLAAARKFGKAPSGAEIKTRFLYNPELNSHWFIVPGLSVVIIGLLCVLLTALTVAKEWENGSMELLLATPVRPLEIIAGKLAPYFVLSSAGVAIVYLAARLVFGVPFRGSLVLYIFVCSVFILTALAQGLFISVATRQQQIAMQFSIVSGLLPSLLLSGFIFSVENMPPFFQYFTALLSPRWFMEAARGIFLKGSGPAELALPLAALCAILAALVALALAAFKTDVEP